jgi:hypothetical protein
MIAENAATYAIKSPTPDHAIIAVLVALGIILLVVVFFLLNKK